MKANIFKKIKLFFSYRNLIKENYNIYAKKEILQDNFDTDYNIVYANFIVILKKNDEIKGVVSSLIYKDEDLTNIYREKKWG